MSHDQHPDAVVLDVRADDLDTNGHVRGPAYLAYADHARWATVSAAGIDHMIMSAAGVGPVNLETTLRFHTELRPGGRVVVSTVFDWSVTGSGRTTRVRQELRREDGTLAAEVTSVSGLLDLTTRQLVADPRHTWRELTPHPELIGLPDEP